jgi:Uma2 family endonuclease
MATLITETLTHEELRARQESGGDRYDEVWDGVYLMSPLANVEHQILATQLAAVIQMAIGLGDPGIAIAGVNVSDREEDWTKNYRCPDVAVILKGCAAKNCGTHWCGGPDFLIEIVSPDDRSRQKFDFYASIEVRELLIIDRTPWALELYRLEAEELQSVGRSTVEAPLQLQSTVLPLNFRLVPGDARPVIEVTHNDGRQTWRI